MHPAFRPLPQRVLYALKLASWPKMLVPALVGQVLGGWAAGWSWCAAGFGLVFTVLAVIQVVLLNDWFDVRVDAIKREMFPHAGGPKTIPDAVLHPQTVLLMGAGAGLCAAAVGLCAELALNRPGLAGAGVLCLGLILIYSAPPLRFNDRGVGEWVEAVGVGAMLPWFHAYLQSGQWWSAELVLVMPGLMAMALASAIASGLADEESDRMGAKVTIATLLGNDMARRNVEYAVLAAALLWAIAARIGYAVLPPLAFSVALMVMLWQWRQTYALGHLAVTNAFAQISRYKQALHRTIWWSALAFVLVLVLLRWLGVAG